MSSGRIAHHGAHPSGSFLLATIAAIVMGVTSDAFAFSSIGGRWATTALPVPYRINLASAPASIGMTGARTASEAGFAAWAAPACTAWRSTNAGTTALTRARVGDRENSILWISGAWPMELGDPAVVIGVTTPAYTTGRIFEADIQYNNVGFRWSLDGAAGTVDTLSIATHEEGHFLGLGHSTTGRAIMFASYGGGIKRTLDADDQSGVCSLYPIGGGDAGIVDAGTSGGEVGDTCSASLPCYPGNGCACLTATDCFCTRMCSASTPCPSTANCVDTGMGLYCIPRGSGAVGDPCMEARSCSSSICLRPATGAAFCSRTCSATNPCGAGSNCLIGSTGGFCVPAGAGAVGAVCTDFRDCASSVCLNPGSGASFCSAPCTGASTCPARSNCLPAAMGMYCIPSGTGAIGTACTRPDQCVSSICLTGAGANYCSGQCTSDCMCGVGFRCVASSVAGVRICVRGVNPCFTDAGFPADEGVVEPDTGTAEVDAGITPDDPGDEDAGSTDARMIDAGRTADAGQAMTPGGCGCSTPARSSHGGAVTALAMLGLVALRRRRSC